MIDFIVQLNEQCYGMLNDTSRRMYRVARLQDDFPCCVYIKQGTRNFRSHQTILIKRDEKFIRTKSSARRARPIVREKLFALTVICSIMKNIMSEARGVIPFTARIFCFGPKKSRNRVSSMESESIIIKRKWASIPSTFLNQR